MPNHYRAYAGADPELEGDVVDGAASFDSGKVTISHVVFYAGEGDDETVAGSVFVNRSGKFSLSFVEATDADEAQIVEA